MNKFLTILLLVFTFCHCSSPDIQNKTNSYHFEISDSIKIDHLTPLKLRDYSPKTEAYLLSTEWNGEVVELKSNGKVNTTFKIVEDGPNSISSPTGIGYLNDEITLYSMEKGFVQLNRKGEITNEYKIPYPHSYLFFLPYLQIFPSDNGYTYLKPLQNTDFKDGMGEKFYRKYYKMPLLEHLDTTSQQTVSQMKFPATSNYSDGNNHGLYIPIIRKDKSNWFVSLWLENQIYVYKNINQSLQLDTTLVVPIEGMAKYKSIPLSKSEDFFEINEGTRAGHISDILFTDDFLLVIYRKGLTALQTQNIDDKQKDLEIEKRDPFFAAIYDKKMNLLAPEVPFPPGIDYPSVANKNGEIVVMKKPELLEIEDDQLTLYLLKITSK